MNDYCKNSLGKDLPLPLFISEDYEIDHFIPDRSPHDCRDCGTNLDVYSIRLEIDHVRPEFYDVRCQRCGSVTTIEDLTLAGCPRRPASGSGKKGRD